MSTSRLWVSKADKNTNADVRSLFTFSVRPPQSSRSSDLSAMAEEAFEDFLTGVGATAVGEHGSKVARQDEATSNLFRDLDEQVEQARAVHSRPEEVANRIGKLCERLEYEASEVDALRSSKGEPVSHFREMVDSRQLMPGSCELNQLRPGVH